MSKIIPNPPKIEIDFTDARLTGQGGWALLARAARELELPRRLSEAVRLKRRDRGASDGEMLWSLVASLSAGNGALSDLDALRDDLDVAELVRRHRGKQGHENAFKGPLIDLDLHHPPCRRFLANQAFYACGQLAQLLLRAVQYELLPVAARTHDLRTLIRHLVRTVARLVHTGKRRRLDFAKSNFRLDWLLYATRQLE